jgi:hypothetical protein
VWSSQALKWEVRDKRKAKKAKKRSWVKSQQSQPLPCAPAVPQKRQREVDNEDENGEDDWAEIAREERMVKKVIKGVTAIHEIVSSPTRCVTTRHSPRIMYKGSTNLATRSDYTLR